MLDRGITLAKYYVNESLRIQKDRGNPELKAAEKLLDWLLDVWKEPRRLVSLADIYQRGPAVVRDRAEAERAVKLLLEHDWFTEFIDATGKGIQVNGITRKKIFT